jgi:hypothetical protein
LPLIKEMNYDKTNKDKRKEMMIRSRRKGKEISEKERKQM